MSMFQGGFNNLLCSFCRDILPIYLMSMMHSILCFPSCRYETVSSDELELPPPPTLPPAKFPETQEFNRTGRTKNLNILDEGSDDENVEDDAGVSYDCVVTCTANVKSLQQHSMSHLRTNDHTTKGVKERTGQDTDTQTSEQLRSMLLAALSEVEQNNQSIKNSPDPTPEELEQFVEFMSQATVAPDPVTTGNKETKDPADRGNIRSLYRQR